MSQFEVKVYVVEPDHKETRIEFREGDKTAVSVALSAKDLDNFISHLALQREKMAERVPTSLEAGTQIRGQNDPTWACVGAKEATGPVLAIRHPGFGWLGFQFSPDKSRAIAAALGSNPSEAPTVTPDPKLH
jgi:hypothetical protein